MISARLRFPFVLSSLLLVACGGSPTTDTKENDKPKPTKCSNDEDCGAASFCAGSPRCLPENEGANDIGCVEVNAPCRTGQTCDESTKSCATDCPVTKDADQDGHDARECGGDDCDDSSIGRFPGNAEVCDTSNLDEDCDPTTFGYRDADGDDYADAKCCNTSDAGKKACGTDCNDQEPRVHPTQLEACDGLDNDCNGKTDDVDGESAGYFLDSDGDLYGDPNAPLLDCTVNLEAYVTNKSDCNDADGDVNPGEKDNDCDSLDDNCDGTPDDEAVSVYFVDADGDGEGDPNTPAPPCSILGQAAAYDGRDCDDANPMRAPYLVELQCDGIDNNCNGIVDADGMTKPTWYYDADADGFGDFSVAGVVACSSPDPGKYTTSVIADCAPSDPTIYPGAPELCDRKDNNCSTGGGVVNEEDADSDGHSKTGISICSGGFPADDCDDTSSLRYPGRALLCDGVDNDCDGLLDTAEDADRDGFAKKGCLPPGGKADCNDNNDDVYSGAADICDNVVNDCDDINGGKAESEDVDGDGFRGLHTSSCTSAYDCNDVVPAINTSASEVCDGIDNDCNEGADEGCASSLKLTSATTSAWIMAPGLSSHGDMTANCAAGSVMVGVRTIQAKGGVAPQNVLSYLTPKCRPLTLVLENFTPKGAAASGATTPAATLSFFGNSTGSVDRDCSDGAVMTQLSVQAEGNYFTATQASCGTLSYDSGATAPKITNEVQLGADGGRNTGGGGTLSCPAGYVPTGMHSGMSGSPIAKQGIAMTCSKIELVHTTASLSVVLDDLSTSYQLVSDSSKTTVFEAVCPANQFVAGFADSLFNDGTADRLKQLQIRCAGFSGSLSALTRSTIAPGAWTGVTSTAASSVDCAAYSFVRSIDFGDTGNAFDDSYSFECSPVVSPNKTAGTVGAGTEVNVKVRGGRDVFSYSCGGSRFAYGVRAFMDVGGTKIGQVQLLCAESHIFQ